MTLVSQTTGEETKPAQFLAELVCLRYGKKKHLPTPPRFWNLPEWRKLYGRQIQLAHGLLKLFSFESILSALASPEASWVFSLSFPGLVDIIKLHEARLVKETAKAAEPQPTYETKIGTEVAHIRQGRSITEILEGLE